MKKAILIASAILALCSCAKIQEDVVLTEISFDAAAFKSSTKAAGDPLAGPIEGSYYGTGFPNFRVYSLFLESDSATWESNNSDATLYAEVDCSYDATNTIWKGTPTAYWPLSGSLTFVGFSPNSIATSFEKSTDGAFQLKTSNAYEINDQIDVLYTRACDADNLTKDNYLNGNTITYPGTTTGSSTYLPEQGSGNNSTGVPIVFRHALSQVVVNVAADTKLDNDIKFQLTDLSFVQPESAKLSVNQQTEAFQKPVWSDFSSTSTTTTMVSAGEIEINNFATPSSFSSATENKGILVFPMLSTQEPKLSITYKQFQRRKAGADEWSNAGTKTIEIPILTTSTDLTELVAGKKYVLNLILDATRIKYAPMMIDWEANPSEGSYNIPNNN